MLEPYRVLDLTNECGLLCGEIPADLGADVIAVEPPGGSSARKLGPFVDGIRDPERSLYWWAYSRNKRSVTADFLLESLPPGYLDGLGLGHSALRMLNPRLVM